MGTEISGNARCCSSTLGAKEFEMKVMVITGASRGIGAATARAAGRNGYTVVVNFNQTRAPAEGLVAEINREGGKAFAIGADVSRSEEAGRLFAEVDRLAGTPSVLVNNAGIIGGTVPISKMSEETVTKVFAANVFSAFYCSREAVARMSTEQGGRGGSIINMSSAAARHGGLPNETHYASSKGAIDSFTVSLAKEVGRQNIRVNALRPGLIDTS